MAKQGRSHSSRFHLLACAGYSLLCIAWTAWAGRDQNWDLLNYHVYVAQAWWQGRIPGEWFAAAGQSYLNPLPHLPFFALLAAGWHSLAIGSALALLHSANLWLLHGITHRLIPIAVPRRGLFVIGGVLLGGLAPAFLLETGTSFVDVIVSLPSLAALLCVLVWMQQQESAARLLDYRLVWLAFGLAGFAIGLKPTAALFGFALGIGSLLANWRATVAICWRAAIATSVGAVLGGGAQAWKLWTAFGNPVFPMFNQVFRSPFFVGESVAIDRFRPASLIDALRYPLDLANAFRLRGLEGISVDLRPLSLLCLLGVSALAFAFWSRPRRETVLFTVTLVLSVSLWLSTSGNIRYAIESFLLIGPATALLLAQQQGAWRKPALLALLLIVAAQTTVALTLNMVRFGGSQNARWEREWVPIDIPAPLGGEPAYYLSLQIQSYSLLARLLPPQSRLSNIVGQVTFDPRSAAWQAIVADREARQLPWRSLYAIPNARNDGALSPSALDHQDALLSTYGLRADRGDCRFIDVNGRGLPGLHWELDTDVFRADASGRAALVSCALQPAALAAEEIQRRDAMDERLRRWEDRCPAFFSPRTSSEQGVQSRSRFYGKSDTTLSVTTKTGKLYMRKATLGLSVQLEDADGRALIEACPDLRTANQDGGRSR